jgi:hypothetical protein
MKHTTGTRSFTMGYTSGETRPHIGNRNYENVITAVSINNNFKHLKMTISFETCSVT